MPETETTTPQPARVRLDAPLSHTTVLDGGWWPRSADVSAELPGLIDAVANQRGTVTHALLNSAEWDLPHPRRITAGGQQVRLGWFTSQPAGLVTMITDFNHDRYDLLVVPSRATSAEADAAMAAAADGGNTQHTPALLATIA